MTETTSKRPWWKTAACGIWSYLKDWRNLVSHAALGFVLLALAIWLPVVWWVRLLIIAALVGLNTMRMRRSKAKEQSPAENAAAPAADAVTAGAEKA